MKKTVILVIAFLFTGALSAQKMITRTGELKFDATVPGAMDEVIGTNKTASALFDKSTGELVVLGLIKSFKFKSPLMEEHFNENYMESDKFPKANFKGKLLKFDGKPGSFDLEGDLTIHGVTNKIKTKVSLAGDNKLSGSFVIRLSDYKLEVPALAKKTLAETAKITIALPLENKQ